MVTRLSRKFRLFAVLALILSFVLPQAAVLAEEPPVPGTNSFAGDGSMQTDDATTTDDATSTSVIADPLRRFTGLSVQGGYVAAGTAMRNRGYGTIELTGIPAGSKIVAAYLYWDVLANFASDSLARGRIMPDPGGVFGRIPSSGLPLGFSIQGTLVGTGGDPCWGNMHNFAYRADVTKLVFGNGRYQLSGFASGATDGRDPWIQGSQAPMLEGASLVVIYSNPSSQPTQVMIYEGSNLVAGSSTSQVIEGFGTISSVSNARTTFIGADGQDMPGPGSSFNGHPLPEVHWDGNDPQSGSRFSQGNLWDTMTVDVTDLVPPGSTSAVATVDMSPVNGQWDCVVWVAQVLSVSTGISQSSALFAPPTSGLLGYLFHWRLDRPGCLDDNNPGRSHQGIDIWTNSRGIGTTLWSPKGNEVRSPYDGHIVGMFDDQNKRAVNSDGTPTPLASMIVIDHGTINGQHIYTLYSHMANANGRETYINKNLREGQSISKNSLLGYQGNAGTSITNPGHITHLHFEVKTSALAGHDIDPSPYLGRQLNRCEPGYPGWHAPYP